MLRRPWPLVLLAGIYFFLPFLALSIYGVVTHHSAGSLIELMTHNRIWLARLGPYFLLCPLAGTAIYAIRSWSYPFLLVVWGFTLYLTLRTATSANLKGSLAFELVACLSNILLATYLSMPTVRALYLDRRFRWWESAKRYRLNLGAQSRRVQSGSMEGCKILNLSSGGALILSTARKNPEPAERVEITFALLNSKISLPATVVYQKNIDLGTTYGVHFLLNDRDSKAKLNKLLRSLDFLGTPVSSPVASPAIADFGAWLKGLVTTGRGLLPQFSKNFSEVAIHDKSDST